MKIRVQASKPLLTLLLAALLRGMFLATFPVQATMYYIATNGNDSWTGTAAAFVSGKTGPWQDFVNINYGGKFQLQPGDLLYIHGGVYDHTSDWVGTSLNLACVNGTPSSPIVISNYPGETPIIFGSGSNNNTISLKNCNWVKIFGINSTNAYRAPCFQWTTNCEVAYCYFGGGNTNYGYLCPFTMYNNSQSNWVHNCVIHDAPAAPDRDSTHCMTFGLFYGSHDNTSFNIIESNTCYHSGHDALSCYGPSNLLRCNFVHNEPWFYRTDLGQLSGHRDMEIGGTVGNHNWVLNNRLDHAGHTWNAGVGIEVSDGIGNLIRGNLMAYNDYAGLVIYGEKVGPGAYNSDWGSNHVAHNTFLKNGYAQRYCRNIRSESNDLNNYKHAVMLVHTRNNLFINNLFCRNYDDSPQEFNGAVNVSVWSHNITVKEAGLADPNDGGCFSTSSPSINLAAGSKAIDAGTWLTRITSPAAFGRTFTVDDAGWFFPGLTTAGHAAPGDTIQLQRQTMTAVIVAISNNTITVDTPLTSAKGQGVSLAYSGAAPDVGAFEFALGRPPATLPTVPPP